MKKDKILFVINVDWFFLSHRLPIAVKALSEGYEVHVATKITDKAKEIHNYGFILHDIDISRGDLGFFSSLKAFLQLISLYKKINPQLVHLVTIKPIILGGIAARITKVRGVIAAISGLGYIFINQGFWASLRRFFIKMLYKLSLNHPNIRVICQNKNDLHVLREITRLHGDVFTLINGSGVALDKFKFLPCKTQIPNIMMASRLLIDKGVIEFLEAAKILSKKNIKANFILVGEPDLDNPSSITQAQIVEWESEGIIDFWGHRDNMHEVLPLASIVVLPSYREGFPKILIEAAACGRAVITTDVPGCRDAIYNEVTGLLVPMKDSHALADAIEKLVSNMKYCQKMGQEGRSMAEVKFDEKKVIKQHLEIYNQLLLN